MAYAVRQFPLALHRASRAYVGDLPPRARLLAVDRQGGAFFAFALVDLAAAGPTLPWRIALWGTDTAFEAPDDPRYLNTVYLASDDEDRPHAFHAFDLGPAETAP